MSSTSFVILETSDDEKTLYRIKFMHIFIMSKSGIVSDNMTQRYDKKSRANRPKVGPAGQLGFDVNEIMILTRVMLSR
jgi:hypothetical protein